MKIKDFPELDWLPEVIPVHHAVHLLTENESQFPVAHQKLIELGLIPKPFLGPSRPLSDIKSNPNIGWEREDCCVLPVPGKEKWAETEHSGWGIYRVVFRKAAFGTLPMVGFKYCFRSTPGEDFQEHRVLEKDPMKEHVQQAIKILNPSSIVDLNGLEIKI